MNDIIVSNTVKCKLCNDVIYSKDRHDFVTCSCGGCSVDGGTDYLRRVGDFYTELSITMSEKVVNNCIDSVKWALDNKRNKRGIAYSVLRALRDNGYNLNTKENA